jgi:hypothetical protein
MRLYCIWPLFWKSCEESIKYIKLYTDNREVIIEEKRKGEAGRTREVEIKFEHGGRLFSLNQALVTRNLAYPQWKGVYATNESDIVTVYDMLNLRTAKSEFETMNEYNARMSRFASENYLFNIEVPQDSKIFKYDAENSMLRIEIAPNDLFRLISSYSGPRLVVKYERFDKDSYSANNAYGASVVVNSYTIVDYSIMPMSSAGSYGKLSIIGQRRVTREQAIEMSRDELNGELQIYAICRPYFRNGRLTANYDEYIEPKFSSPFEVYFRSKVIYANILQIIIYNKRTNTVLVMLTPQC